VDEATHVYSKTRQVYRQLYGDRMSTTTITTTTYLEKNPSACGLPGVALSHETKS